MIRSSLKSTKPAVPADVVASESAALRALYEPHIERLSTERGRKISQEKFGAETGIGGQSMVWQYLEGRRALGIEAAAKFAKALGVKIVAFSPRLDELGKQIVDVLALEQQKGASPLSDVARTFATEIDQHPPEMQARMLAILRLITQPAVTDAEVEKRMPVTATKKRKPPG